VIESRSWPRRPGWIAELPTRAQAARAIRVLDENSDEISPDDRCGVAPATLTDLPSDRARRLPRQMFRLYTTAASLPERKDASQRRRPREPCCDARRVDGAMFLPRCRRLEGSVSSWRYRYFCAPVGWAACSRAGVAEVQAARAARGDCGSRSSSVDGRDCGIGRGRRGATSVANPGSMLT